MRNEVKTGQCTSVLRPKFSPPDGQCANTLRAWHLTSSACTPPDLRPALNVESNMSATLKRLARGPSSDELLKADDLQVAAKRRDTLKGVSAVAPLLAPTTGESQ